MSFITKAFEHFAAEELQILQTRPPTDESQLLALKVGRIMGQYAYSGDCVLDSVSYEAGRLGWPGEIASTIGSSAFEGMQQSYNRSQFEARQATS